MLAALRLMQREQGNCLPIVEPSNSRYLGLITERELVKALAQNCSLEMIMVAETMRNATVRLGLDELDQPIQVLQRFRQWQVNGLPVVDSQQRLLGILSRQSFQNTLKPTDLLQLKQAAAVMVTDVAVILPKTPLQVAVETLAAQDISSLVVVTDAAQPKPIGILTEEDILSYYETSPELTTTPVAAIISQPVISVTPTDSLWQVHLLMEHHAVCRIVVVDEQGYLAGLVTQSSILGSVDSQEATWIVQLLQDDLNQATAELRWQLTQQQVLTAAIAESELRSNTLLTHLPAVVYRRHLDEQWTFIYSSDYLSELTGYGPGMIPSLGILIFPEDWKQAITQIQAALLKKEPYVVEYRLNRANGATIWVQDRGQQEPEQAILSGILIDITGQRRQEELLQTHLQRELLISTISQNIRRSLDLGQVMQSAADDVRQLLQTDRVLVFRLLANGSGVIEVESVAHPSHSLLGRFIYDPCFLDNPAGKQEQGYIGTISDTLKAKLHPCHRQLLLGLNVRANLVVSIQHNAQIWGLLLAQQCQGPRLWLTEEIHLLQRISDSLAVAVNQAELYQQLGAANQELQQLVYVDGLTQIGNRRQFGDVSLAEWRRAAREQTPMTLVLADIDFFKPYNDYYGKHQGDAILYRVAQQLTSTMQRPGDVATRYGGEEFALILPQTDQAGAVQVVKQIQADIATLAILHAASQVSGFLTLSFGIATTTPRPTEALDNLITTAEKALHQAKSDGRNGYVTYRTTLDGTV